MINDGSYGRMFYADKMYPYLRGVLTGATMKQSQKALQYMREHHAGQYRKDGQPYEIHPMMMACYATSLPIGCMDRDSLVATVLLHDVCEDTAAELEEIPFNDVIKRGVKYMTLTRFDDETKYEQKRRYMNELLESKEATITKAIDRYFNLMTMPGTFSEEKMRKNVVETDQLLIPVLKKAKRKWPELASLLHILRMNVRSVNDLLAMQLKVQLIDPDFVNAPDAKDYSYLIMDS